MKGRLDAFSVGRGFLVLSALCVVLAACIVLYDARDDDRAGQEAAIALAAFQDKVDVPDVRANDRHWSLPAAVYAETTVTVDGVEYLGQVSYPSLGIELPVISEWSTENAKIAPCRYAGSVGTSNLCIAGHSYKSHFRPLRQSAAGDLVQFVDAEGREFWYQVQEIEVIDGYDLEGMAHGDWDLTLFTCTPDSQSRVTVRCTYYEQGAGA